MSEENLFWMTTKRFIIIGVFLLIVFLGLMVLIYLKADEITKDPCSICAEYMGEKVICSTGTAPLLQKTYYPNGTIIDNAAEVNRQIARETFEEINLTKAEDLFEE